MTLFKRTGGEEFPDRIKCMISGPPKSGKTSFLGTVPNIVIADTEQSANNLQSVAHLNLPYVTINSTDDLHKLLFVLRDETMRKKAAESLGLPEIEAVAIDTLDTLQQIMKAERLKETRQTQFLRDDWAWIKDEMIQIIRAFTALPLHVFFIVHTKSSEVGKGDDARTRILPSLQGAIAEEIAGMVGYSLLSFRKQEIRPDGSTYTKYWLRAEGDETYDFLGNRAAGRLPDVIEPRFAELYVAATTGHKEIAKDEVQTPVEISRTEEVAQNEGQPTPETGTDGQEPVNAAALSHVKKVFDAVSVSFPEELVRSKTLDEARLLVKMWKAFQADAVSGSVTDPQGMMRDFMFDAGWLASPEAEDRAEINILDGTIDQILAWIGDSPERAQEAYKAEVRRDKPRTSLLKTLISKGAEPPNEVTSEEPQADDPETDLVINELGGTVVVVEQDAAPAPCDECGKPVDDLDLAALGKTRYGRWLCVQDYITAGKA